MRKPLGLSYVLFGIIAGYDLTGCAGLSPATVAVEQPSRSQSNVKDPAVKIPQLLTGHGQTYPVRDKGRSWLASPSSTRGMLYVSDFTAGDVKAFSYPDGTAEGVLTGLSGPSGMCTDSSGNIWVTDTLDQRLEEFRPGDPKRVAILNDPDEYPVGCSVDPTTGNLAVTNIYGSASPGLTSGNLMIYKSARGRPIGPYYDSVMYYMYFCGYDSNGNLFFDGESYGGQFRFAELPENSASIVDITIDQNIVQPGDIEMNSGSVVIGDQQSHVLYQLSIDGTQAYVTGTTPLQKTAEIEQFAVMGDSVIAADGTSHRASTWSYPAGGLPSSAIRHLNTPIGLVITASGQGEKHMSNGVAMRPVLRRHKGHFRSWMSPSASKSDLLYVADSYNFVVDVYSYPEGQALGTLTGFNLPQGECSDDQGNVYITNTNTGQILEYAHAGTTPIATFNDPHENPVGCAINPKTGELAVTNLTANGYGGSGSLALFAKAGSRKLYFDPDIYFMFFCGYDDKGDIFVDGQHFGGGGTGFQLAELTPKAKVFRNIAMPVVVGFPGGVQWDGSNLAIGDQAADVIFTVRVTGITASVIGSTPLTDGLDVVQFWKQGHTIIGPDSLGGDVGFWKYPKGGDPENMITGLGGPEGATVSVHR